MMTQYTPIPTRYSRVAIWLHWLLAAALAGQIALGFSMPHDASGFALFQLHKSIGITIGVSPMRGPRRWKAVLPASSPRRCISGFTPS